MDRREMLKSSLALAAGSLGMACAGRGREALSRLVPAGPRRFAVPTIGRDRIVRTIAGLRPYRPSGFRVETEKLGRTIVVHNYGHGGGGITLSWGTSHLAAQLVRQASDDREVAVLGAGAVGLTSARLLQDRGYDVTIYARDLPPETTSNVAAGQWSPASVAEYEEVSAHWKRQFERACRFSHDYYQSHMHPRFGIRWIENYALENEPPEEEGEEPSLRDLIRDLYPESRLLQPGEHPFPAPYVRQYDTMFIETQTFLHTLLDDFYIRGGEVEVRELHQPRDVARLPQRTVVNCTGLGSRELFGDEELMPIKGQLAILLPEPEVDYILIAQGIYMFPRSDGILLGGSHERGVWDPEPTEPMIRNILNGHEAVFGEMAERARRGPGDPAAP